MIPVWHVLDRETGELIDTAAPGSQMDKALLAGSPAVLFSHEVAHNTLTSEVIYR